jgi:DNA-binding transcriptional ArsR family regulator
MDTFSALATPTRRNIVELLAQTGQLSAGEICDQFQITPSAISQHLKVLRQAKLVQMVKDGQKRLYRINPEPVAELAQWVQRMQERFDRLEAVIEAEKRKQINSSEGENNE